MTTERPGVSRLMARAYSDIGFRVRLVGFAPLFRLGNDFPAFEVEANALPLDQLIDSSVRAAQDVAQRERPDRSDLRGDQASAVGHANPDLGIGLGQIEQAVKVDEADAIAVELEVKLVARRGAGHGTLGEDRGGLGPGHGPQRRDLGLSACRHRHAGTRPERPRG